MRLILIRHGETDWNVEGRYQGQEDPTLNQTGITQSYQLADELINTNLDILYTSPLQRASQTARIISEELDIPLFIEQRFMEIHQGDWQKRLRSEIENLYPDLFQKWEDEPWEARPPNGETLHQVQDRVYTALDEIISRHQNQIIGIVCHRIPIALIKMRYQGVDQNIVRKLKLPNIYYEEIQIPGKHSDDA
jgi:broad specificity phosphatase PhoE